MADLDLKVKSKQEQDGLIDDLMKSPKSRALAATISTAASLSRPQPEKAKRVVQSLVSIFVESSLGDKRKDSTSAKQFIDEQVKAHEKKLRRRKAASRISS
jgi:hypothetical protein